MTRLGPAPESPVSIRPWWREWEALALVVLALTIYGTRLTAVTVRGEESRWARAAYEMVSTGEWAVPRQQGELHADRPPLAIWTIALSSLVCGDFDEVSIRLPSVLATLLTGLVIYAYGRTFLSPVGALAAGAAYLTMGQVLQLGRLAENDAVFALLVSGSLMAWHAGYSSAWRLPRAWPAAATWCAGYALAALATLTKGPQGTAYFCGPVVVYLVLVRRDLPFLFSRWHLLGLLTFLAIYAAWLVPYYLATDWPSVVQICWATSAMRFAGHSSLWKHLLMYPLEILACTLPWSPLLIGFARPAFWRLLGAARPHVVFLLTCLGVTFPSVWFATEAHPRYFMSIFPCLALAVGVMIERCAESAAGSWLRRGWRLTLTIFAGVALAAGLGVVGAGFFTGATADRLAQAPAFSLVYLLAAGGAAAALIWSGWGRGARAALVGVGALAGFVGLSFTGVAITSQARSCQDFAAAVAGVKQQLPEGERLVSFGRLDHLFTYYFRDSISVSPWPDSQHMPADGEYFCFTPTPGTPDELPFAWQQVALLTCSRTEKLDPERLVIVGRRVDVPVGVAAADTRTRRY